MKKLYLSFPQWQGGGNNKVLYEGAKALTQSLSKDFDFKHVSVKPPYSIEKDQSIWGFDDILSQLQSAIKSIENNAPDKIFTIGGGCDTELAPINYLNHKLQGDMLVLWIDAHADLNIPQSSPSHEFHGMPLRTLMHEGNSTIIDLLDKPLNPNHVFLIGVRDCDPPEEDFIKGNDIKIISVPKNEEEVTNIVGLISATQISNIYLHIDLDVLDPQHLSSVKCPTSNGMNYNTLIALIQRLKINFNVVGGNVLEYTHIDRSELNKVHKVALTLFD